MAGDLQTGAQHEPPVQGSRLEQKGQKIQERGQWANKWEFILAVAGSIVGLANMWRFPYLCYKNGGGAFFIPYVLFLFTCGIPLFLLETAMGQYTSQGIITCWRKTCPLFEGVGYASQVIITYATIYYIIILAWAFFYLFSSFSSELPWASCRNTWNTDSCLELEDRSNSSNTSLPGNATTPVMEFWERRVLAISGGIDEVGNLRWELALCLLLSWVICYFCVWKGVKSTGKVVYFTATFPYVMLVVLLTRGLTLPGAIGGIIFYLYPDPARLADPQVWMDAGTQIFFSYGISLGILKTLSSYNRYNNDCYRDTFWLCLLNSGTSFVFGFAIFSVLGFMAQEQGVDISEVAESGPGLAFIVYPRALALMPLPQLWSVCFFLTVIVLGVGSQFVHLETMAAGLMDLFPGVLRRGHGRQLLLLLLCGACFLLGLLMVTEGGLYLFQIFDFYSCSGFVLLFISVCQSLAIGWVYGADRLYDNIEDMIGYRPRPLIKYCWLYITPVVCTGTFIFSLVKYTPLKFNNTYVYPDWGYALGWLLALSSILSIPLWTVYKLWQIPGTLHQRLVLLCCPADDLPREQKPPDSCPLNSDPWPLTEKEETENV